MEHDLTAGNAALWWAVAAAVLLVSYAATWAWAKLTGGRDE